MSRPDPAFSQTDGTPVLVEVGGGVMKLTLNRPHVRNALNRAASSRIAEAMDEFEANPDIRAAVITGACGTFCAGTDLAAHAMGESMRVGARGFYGFVERPPEKPVIAAVEGYAVGGGFELALACDAIVAGAGAQLGLPEVRHGVFAGAGGVWRVAKRAPYHVAMELALTGALVSAGQARSFNLVDEVVADGAALDRSRELAMTLASARRP